MSAPKRWLDDAGDAGADERDVLRAGLSIDPPPGAQGDVWAALLTKLPPPPGGPPSDGGSSAGAAGNAAGAGKAAVLAKAAAGGVGVGLLKSVLIGAGGAVALIATYSIVTPSTPDASRPAAAVTSPPPADAPRASALPDLPRAAAAPSVTASASASAEPVIERRVEPRSSARPAAIATAEPAPAALDRETMLREESRLVAEARDALRRGDASGALTMLDQIRAKFPGGMLTQEREALTIEALARSGRKGDAAARADAFVKAYPTSPLASRVQQFAH